jgi:hypothetical protein
MRNTDCNWSYLLAVQGQNRAETSVDEDSCGSAESRYFGVACTTLRSNYVYSRGLRALRSRDINAPSPANLPRYRLDSPAESGGSIFMAVSISDGGHISIDR